MNTGQLIAKKRDGNSLTADEIDQLVFDFTSGNVPDYQMAALAMANICPLSSSIRTSHAALCASISALIAGGTSGIVRSSN